MNSYKVKGIILAVIISLASIMMPFSVYADSITLSNINGVSVTLDEVTFIENVQYSVAGGTLTVQRNFFNYIGEIQFDKSYLGYVNISYKYYFTGRNDTGPASYNQTKTQKIFVNGDKAYFTFSFIANSSVDPLSYTSSLLTLNSSDLTEYGLLSDIETIIDILNDNQDIINDIYSELQTVVSNTSLANDYLANIIKIRQYNIPFESFNFVNYLMSYNFEIFEYNNYKFYNFPIFLVPKGNNILRFYLSYGRKVNIVMGINASITSESTIKNILGLDSNLDITNIKIIDVFYQNDFGYNTYGYISSFTIENNTNQGITVEMKSVDRPYEIIPIYFNFSEYSKYISTDFALQFGLTNELLDNLNIIANGTTQSNSVASDLESEASEYSDIADDVIGVEEGLTSNFETEVNKIDLNSGLNVFGGNFMTSATWVRTQFDRLTENTPYGSLVVYGLTLGFALLMLGKVFL